MQQTDCVLMLLAAFHVHSGSIRAEQQLNVCPHSVKAEKQEDMDIYCACGGGCDGVNPQVAVAPESGK